MTRFGLVVAMVAGLAANVAAGDSGAACSEWARVASPSTGKINTLTAIDARGAANVWAIGREWLAAETREGEPLVVRRSAGTWAVEPLPDLSHLGSAPRLEAVHVGADGEPWVVGHLQDPAGNTYALILQWQGGFWQAHQVVMLNSFAPRYPALRDVTALSASDAWAVGDARTVAKGAVEPFVARWDGNSWAEVEAPAAPGRNRTIAAVTATAGSAWAVGHDLDGDDVKTANARIFRFDGNRWDVVDHPVANKPGAMLHDVVALSANDVWAVGVSAGDEGGIFLHWDGQAWTAHAAPPGARPRSIDGIAADDVWAAGGGLSHWDGVSWTLRAAGESDIAGERAVVAVSGPCDAWMVTSTDGPAGTSTIQRLLAPTPAPPAPLPPTPVGFVASPKSNKEIVLEWRSGGDPTLPAGAEEYVIERCIGTAGECATRFVTVGKAPAGSTVFTDAGLEPASSYTYRIFAVNATGRSAATTPVTATTFSEEKDPSSLPVPEAIPVPAAAPEAESAPVAETEPAPAVEVAATVPVPTVFADNGPRPLPAPRPAPRPSLPPTPTGVVAKTAGATEIVIAWDDVTAPDGSRGGTVVIERCAGGREGCATRYAVVGKVRAASSFVDSGLKPSTAYTYRVYAVNPYGQSERSTPVMGTTFAPESSPLPVPAGSAETVSIR